LRNLDLNPDLRPRVVPVNAAVSGEDGLIDVKHGGTIDGCASAHGRGPLITRVRSVRLSTLIKELGSTGVDPAKFRVRALKADCKGCEYELVRDDALRLFDVVKIEYSGYLVNKTYRELLERLEAGGFKCRIWAHNDVALKLGLDRHGMLTCVKEGGTAAAVW